MPGEGTFGTDNWTKSVEPVYDAAGNVIELKRVLVDGGLQTLMNADYRAARRPKSRTLHTNIGTPNPMQLERKYDYDTDGIGRMSAFRVSVDSTTIVDPILMAGSEVQYEGTKLLSARLLGISNGERTTQWRYDERGRLAQSVHASTEAVTVGAELANAVMQHLNDADFLEKIDKTAPGPGPADDKEFDESTGGHKVTRINGTDDLEYKTADGQENGSLRTEDGRFHYVYDEKSRLRRAILKPASGATSVMQVTYDYSAGGRMIGRRVEIADYAGQPLPDVAPATLPWDLATALQMGPDAVLPAHTTFVWDPISDQLLAVFDVESGKPIRQYIHGGMGLDDPIEVAVAETSGVTRYYPIYDEAGDGGLQVVLTADAKIVARTIIEDPYGDGELAISGPAVDNVSLTATKASDGTISEMRVDVRLTEPIAESTLAVGARLAILDANNNAIATFTENPTVTADDHIVRWTIPGSSWSSLTSTTAAAALSIAVTSDLRSSTFGPAVEVLTAGTSAASSIFTDDHPFEWREPLSRINSRFATLANGSTASGDLYTMTSLAAMSGSPGASSSAARRIRTLADGGIPETADSASALLLTGVFQAQPFNDPFTLKNYVRARWYDPATGTWMGPDPIGYQDSSNLYAFASGDPVNGRDPLGEGKVDKVIGFLFPGWDEKGRTKASAELHAAADKIDKLAEEALDGTDDTQWFTRSAAQTMQLASGFLRTGDTSGKELAEGKSGWQVFQNRVYEGMPMEEARALIQDWDTLTDADKARLISMGISKTASVVAGALGLQQLIYKPAAAVPPPVEAPPVNPTKPPPATPRVTDKGLARVEAHLDDVLKDQFPEFSRADQLKFQAGERGMLERLRSGSATPQDIEFYLHELKESARFRATGDLMSSHNSALEWRGVTSKDLFHPDVIRANPDIFPTGWCQP
jgi:RHS repeat-associated protein